MTAFRVMLSASPALAEDEPMVRSLLMLQLHEHAALKDETLDEGTVREVERQAMIWVEDGGKDDDGDPTGFYAEIGGMHVPDESAKPELVMIMWEGESR